MYSSLTLKKLKSLICVVTLDKIGQYDRIEHFAQNWTIRRIIDKWCNDLKVA